jgi:hypothetical protein
VRRGNLNREVTVCFIYVNDDGSIHSGREVTVLLLYVTTTVRYTQRSHIFVQMTFCVCSLQGL